MPASHTVEHPTELLAFLFACRPEVKRTKVRQWLKHGSVQVNGRSVTRSNHPLQTGDMVSIRSKGEVRAEGRLPPGLKLLFEDASLIVIEKPEDLLSMANAAERNKTAYAFLTHYVRRGNPQSPERVWIVHRLDRETSGLMVFAKSETAKRTLQAHWYETEKRYLAVVEGHPPADQGVLSSHLDESRPFKVYSAPLSDRTRHAVTRYRMLKRNRDPRVDRTDARDRSAQSDPCAAGRRGMPDHRRSQIWCPYKSRPATGIARQWPAVQAPVVWSTSPV